MTTSELANGKSRIVAPVLIDGELNDFRHLDSDITLVCNVPVPSGQTIVVALKFANAPDVDPEGPGIAELGDCLSGRYTQFSVLAEPEVWFDLCELGFPRNVAIRAVLEDSAAVSAAST